MSPTTTLTTTSDEGFTSDVLGSAVPVLVDFTASWCGPCRMVTPVLEQIAVEQAGRLRVLSLDVDKNPLTAATHGVLGMPTMLLFKQGKVVAQIVGARPRTMILRTLEPHLT